MKMPTSKEEENAFQIEFQKLESEYSVKYPEAFDLLMHKGKLAAMYGDWDNVAQHCLVQAKTIAILAEKLGLDAETQRGLEIVALIHDWRKRIERQRGQFTDNEISDADTIFHKIVPDQMIFDSVDTGFSKQVLDGLASLSQKIMFYIDNITQNNEITNLKERLDEVEKRRPELNEDGEWTKKLGGRFWDVERMASVSVEKELFESLQRAGEHINSQEDVPAYLRAKLTTSLQE